MLPKKHRLSLRKELRRVQKEGKIYHFPFFGLLVNKELEIEKQRLESRFAFIVSKKIHKKAVKRNRIKRLLRESVQLLLPKTKPGFEILFLVKKTIVDQDFKTVSQSVAESFKKIRAL